MNNSQIRKCLQILTSTRKSMTASWLKEEHFVSKEEEREEEEEKNCE